MAEQIKLVSQGEYTHIGDRTHRAQQDRLNIIFKLFQQV